MDTAGFVEIFSRQIPDLKENEKAFLQRAIDEARLKGPFCR
jgi:hypothetical protein